LIFIVRSSVRLPLVSISQRTLYSTPAVPPDSQTSTDVLPSSSAELSTVMPASASMVWAVIVSAAPSQSLLPVPFDKACQSNL